MIVRGERKVRVIYPLLIGDPSRITAGKPARVKIERQQLLLVRPVAYVKVGLPQIVRAIIPLPVRTHISAIKTKFQRALRLLNRIESGIISVSATELFGIKTPW
jgi:hypothetical protein